MLLSAKMRFFSVLGAVVRVLGVASSLKLSSGKTSHVLNLTASIKIEMTVMQKLKACLTSPCQFRTQDGMTLTRLFGSTTTDHGQFVLPLGTLPVYFIETREVIWRRQKLR